MKKQIHIKTILHEQKFAITKQQKKPKMVCRNELNSHENYCAWLKSCHHWLTEKSKIIFHNKTNLQKTTISF